MTAWEIDFYRRPLQDQQGNALWEWVVCDTCGNLLERAFCAQPEVNSDWVTQALKQLSEKLTLPDRICVFRPQTLNLLEPACRELDIPLQPTRYTPHLKQILTELAAGYVQMPGQTHENY